VKGGKKKTREAKFTPKTLPILLWSLPGIVFGLWQPLMAL
jgi:hypothetical protein